MKRLLFLCLSVLLLLCSCAGANPDFQPVMSANEAKGYTDFACTVVMGSEETHLSKDAAVQLYEMICHTCADSETVISTESTDESITLIFYTGASDNASGTPYLQPNAVSYGKFIVRENDTVLYSDHVLVSNGTTFRLKEGAYNELRALAEQLIS